MVNFPSSVSNLHRLFTTASSQRGQRQHESVIEESHTYDLLYHEGGTHTQGQHHVYPLSHSGSVTTAAAASSFDDRGGLDVQSPRDVRIVIAQDQNTRSPQPRILYDSHPCIPSYQGNNGSALGADPTGRPRAGSFTGGLTGGSARRNNTARKSNTAPHSRHASLSQTTQSILTSPISPLSPVNELGGLFGNSKSRATSSRPATSDGESIQGKIARESREETEALLNCMFGSETGLPTTSSTKLHIRPPNAIRDATGSVATIMPHETSILAASPKRRTPLTRSTTAADLQTLSVDPGQKAAREGSSAIWITRLFAVDIKHAISADHCNQTPTSTTGDTKDPNRSASENAVVTSSGKGKAKQLKTPTYGIAILVQLPSHKLQPASSLQGSFGSSIGSPISSSLEAIPSYSTAGGDASDSIEYIISHWNIVDRALSSLEVIARNKIGNELGQLDIPYLAPLVKSPPNPSDAGSTAKPKGPKQPTQLTLQLSAGCLQGDKLIEDVAHSTGKRIALALKVRKVVAGQGRWGVWREEARWIDRWAGGREHNFFFFNLLTAFVGCHTEWLDSLAPSKYKRRHTKYAKNVPKESNVIQHRTVIVSPDKMASRRLVFLLSAFLPGTYSNLLPDAQRRANTSWSGSGLSQSPPVGTPIVRQQSLRRTVHTGARSERAREKIPHHGGSISFSGVDYVPDEDIITDNKDSQQQSRRPSDAKSIRSAALLISSDGSVTRKSSTTTTSTIKPTSAYTVAHFSGPSTELSTSSVPGQRPSSSESLAPLSLQRTLSRSESNEQGNSSFGSQPKSGWGSVFSSFLGVRRDSSTSQSDFLGSSDEGLGISGLPPARQPSASTLDKMVEEADSLRHRHNTSEYIKGASKSPWPSNGYLCPSQGFASSSEAASPAKDIPHRPAPEPFLPKLSIDENDGVIDVDLPPPKSFASSYGSDGSSGLGANTAASSFNDRSSSYLRSPVPIAQTKIAESVHYVAGWLRAYHQDFTLQAIRPYDNLEEDIKRSMRTETTPSVNASSSVDTATDTWTDVCSTLIADTRNFTVTRLILRRKNAKSPHHRTNALCSPDRAASDEEQIIEEPLMDLDPTFIDAVEKVLSHSGESSRVASRTASRAPSPSRRNFNYQHHPRSEQSPGLEVPRSECKRMVLGALEQVARSVSEEMQGSHSGQHHREGRAGKREAEGLMDSTLREGVRSWFREVDGAVGG